MKPSIPRGTRDFTPVMMYKRQLVFNIIIKHFKLFGFEPIETPSIENIATLTGKYGEEGDQLIYKILNSRLNEQQDKERIKTAFNATLEKPVNNELITEKALRYDLTVPFARFVAMNNHTLTYPFKRYQIQPVWRADKPQKGRYREFYQCDADIIGTTSLINEVELINLIDNVFSELKLPVKLLINSRKILYGIAEAMGSPNRLVDIVTSLDKLDKTDKETVLKDLECKQFSKEAINKLLPFLELSGDNANKIACIQNLMSSSEVGLKGVEEIIFIFNTLSILPKTKIDIIFDITLARGISYYTGLIFEAKVNSNQISNSILGGGRYDDLTGVFGLNNMSGVGISFGIDRIMEAMEQLDLFNETEYKSQTNVLFIHFNEQQQNRCLKLANLLRQNGIITEVYPEICKVKKQMEYANKKQIPFVAIIGDVEFEQNSITIKNMQTGLQTTYLENAIIGFFKS